MEAGLAMRKHSFTLIELLIVIIIIGILAALAVPQYEKHLEKARGTEAMQNVRALADSIWMYYIEKGEFPMNLADIDVSVPNTTSKYFEYNYLYSTSQVFARDLRYSELPNGAIFMYFIIYRKDEPTQGSNAIPGEPMGNGWYRYYVYRVKNGGSFIQYTWDGRPYN